MSDRAIEMKYKPLFLFVFFLQFSTVISESICSDQGFSQQKCVLMYVHFVDSVVCVVGGIQLDVRFVA